MCASPAGETIICNALKHIITIMPEIRIKKELLETLFALGKSQHPNEFLAVLKYNGDIIEDLELIPGTISDKSSAGFDTFMMPLGTDTAGSAHSHPTGPVKPSTADLRFFPKTGRYHIIIGAPYDENSWRVFRADGKPAAAEVV